jgi:hypothetical protein
VPKKLILAILVAAVLVPAGGTQPGTPLVQLMPGVTFSRQVQFTAHGPVVVNVVELPKPGGLYALKPVLAGTLQRTEPLTQMEKDLAPTATSVGINGDGFTAKGVPNSMLMQAGVLLHAPMSARSSLGIDSTGMLHVDQIAFRATWQGTGQRHPFTGLNNAAGQDVVALYTSSWGTSTPARSGDVEVVLSGFPAPSAGPDLTGTVTTVNRAGATAIPRDGAVLVATGGQAPFLANEAPVGTKVTVRIVLNPAWLGITDGIGGGPVLVRDGKPVFAAGENFQASDLTPRTARAAVGQLADGSVIFVVVDGGRPGYSTGMTNFELAQTVARLGAVTATAFDPGDSATLAFDGKLLSRPSGAAERPISDALLLLYSGVYAPAPSQPVFSPNGDGVAETESLSYRVVRPSTVTVRLVAPDGTTRFTDTGARVPGSSYPYTFNGRRADGSSDLEGTWQWLVSATDDLGRASSAQRTFTLDNTLGFVSVKPAVLRAYPNGPSLVIGYRLSRTARVTVSIQNTVGALVRTLTTTTNVAGDVAVAWDGRNANGAVVPTGAYVAHVTATSKIGTVDQSVLFQVQRVAPPPKKKPKKH